MIHSFLLIGQSNMAGRGDLSEAPEEKSDKIAVLRNGRWQPLYRPVNQDRPFSGYCLAETFAEDYAKAHPGVTVGLIPCADGGTTLSQWREGGLLFDNAVYQTRLALRTSTLAGILWHQGEADCSESLYPLYEEKLTKIIAALRKEIDGYDIPLILGGLGDYLPLFNKGEFSCYTKVNEALKAVAEKDSFIGYADSSGLAPKSDYMHFNTKSLMEFGHRYYSVFDTLEDKNRIFTEKSAPDDAIRTEMELL